LWRYSDGLFFELPPLASDALPENMLQTICCKLQKDSGTGAGAMRFIFHVCFSISKVLPPLENPSSSHCIIDTGLMDEVLGFRIQSRNADAPLRKYLVAPPSYKGFF
jgi:hypothetical protein